MKISEVTNQQGRITRIRPGQEAEIDNGDGTRTIVDLKKNPQALEKDPRTNRVKVRNNNSSQNKPNSQSTPRVGDRIELDDED